MVEYFRKTGKKIAEFRQRLRREIFPELFREDLKQRQFWLFCIFAFMLALFCNSEAMWDFDAAKLNSWNKTMFRLFKTSFIPCFIREIFLLIGIYGATLLIPKRKYRVIIWSVLIFYLSLFAIGNTYMVTRYCCPANEMPIIINSTDLQEVREYFVSLLMNNKLFLFSAAAGVLLIPAGIVFALWKSPEPVHPRQTGIFLVILAAAAMFIPPCRNGLIFWRNLNAVEFLYRLNETDFHLASADNAVHDPELPAGVKDAFKGGTPVLAVVMIGESDNRHKHALYGYGKNTEPAMSKYVNDPGFIRFSDALSPTASTQHSLYFMFSSALIKDQDTPAKFGINELLQQAGAKVHFLSNQRAHGAWCSMAALIFSQADELSFYTDGTVNTYDRLALLPHVHERLDKFCAGIQQPTALFAHLMGSHYEQVYRVDPQWKKDNAKLLNGMDAYDQSVTYTDSILGEVTAKLAASEVPAFMIYLPDHSETVPTNRSAKTPEAIYYEIPCYIYCNAAYRKAFPEILTALRAIADKPIQTDIAIFLIARLMNMPANIIPAKNDILTKDFVFAPRLIGFGEKVYEKDQK